MTPPTDLAALLRLEAASMAAWPGLKTVMDGPWAVRFGCGYTGRANSISIFEAADDAPARLERGCALLAAQGLPAVVRLGSMAADALTPVLDQTGFGAPYHSVATRWRTLTLRPFDNRVEISEDAPTAEWHAAKDRFHGEGEAANAARRKLVAAIPAPVAFGLVRGEDGQPAALAYVAIRDAVASLNMVVADPARRGKRLAETVCEGLFTWAAAHGAREACLQVQEDNAPALKLYGRMGFSDPLYTYHYRRKETGQ